MPFYLVFFQTNPSKKRLFHVYNVNTVNNYYPLYSVLKRKKMYISCNVRVKLLKNAMNKVTQLTPCFLSYRKHNCYCTQEILSGLRQPVGVVHCGDGSQRLFILEREGFVRILTHNLELLKEPFLDIHKQVQSGIKVRNLQRYLCWQ